MAEVDPRLRTLQEIEWEVERVQEVYEQGRAQADVIPLEDRDEAWREARERLYIQYLGDMKALTTQYEAVKLKNENRLN